MFYNNIYNLFKIYNYYVFLNEFYNINIIDKYK